MPCLKVQRAVPERIAALHTFAAPDTQLFIDYVFEIGIFYIRPLDSTGWTELAFRSCISRSGAWLKVSAAQIAVSAHRVGMHAFHSRMRQNTVDRTFFTLDTDAGVQLPDHLFRRRFAE
jgi:hypothetical protein